MQGSPIHINGDGTPMRSYLYASDLAAWLWTLLFRAPSGEAYNVGSDEAVSIAELAHTVVEALGVSSEVQIRREVIPGMPRAQYVPATAKAREQLGLRVRVNLRDAIRYTAEWHRGA
jgi:dTDP-glucose 4,6-dehydratase